jgi:hypothetical protein
MHSAQYTIKTIHIRLKNIEEPREEQMNWKQHYINEATTAKSCTAIYFSQNAKE